MGVRRAQCPGAGAALGADQLSWGRVSSAGNSRDRGVGTGARPAHPARRPGAGHHAPQPGRAGPVRTDLRHLREPRAERRVRRARPDRFRPARGRGQRPGQVFATTSSDRIRRMALDAVVGPRLIWFTANVGPAGGGTPPASRAAPASTIASRPTSRAGTTFERLHGKGPDAVRPDRPDVTRAAG